MKCQGKTNRATSAKCTSRLLAAFNSSNTNTNRKLRSRKAIRRKSRKPAALPCSLNECHTVDDDNDNGNSGGGGSNDSAEQAQRETDADGGGVPSVKKNLESDVGGNDDDNGGDDEKNDNGDDHRDEEELDEAGPDKEAQGDETDSQLTGDEETSKEDDEDSSDGSDDGKGVPSSAIGTPPTGGIVKRRKKKKKEKKKRPKRTAPATRHIHPCICDLSTKAQARIKAHIRKREDFEMRHTKRLETIDAELRAIEEEIARKQQEEQEQQELFGDKYEVVGKKKKRMKRSARRASMVSLGVKQVINWKKSPKIKVRQNQVSSLRKKFTSYCGERPRPLPGIKKIGFQQSPKIAVRATKTASLRTEFNVKKKQQYDIEHTFKYERPPFNSSGCF